MVGNSVWLLSPQDSPPQACATPCMASAASRLGRIRLLAFPVAPVSIASGLPENRVEAYRAGMKMTARKQAAFRSGLELV